MDQKTSDLIASMQHIKTRRALRTALVEYYRSEGISKVSYHGHFSDGTPRTPTAVGFPENWVRHYVDDHLDAVDPIPRLASQRVRPFRWSEAKNLADLTPEMVAYLLEARLAGLGDGLAMTVFGPNLRNAYVSLGFDADDFDPDEEKIMELQWVAQVAHLRFCEIADASNEESNALSVRERDVLELIAAGKSNSVIATLLEISIHTVDAHLRKIYDKLGVNDRTSAALMAVKRGLVSYPKRR